MTKDEVLKLALEALEPDWELAEWYVDELREKAIIAIREALAQPEQEPVAWLQIGLAPLHDGDVIARTVKPKDWNPEWWRFEPLYTTPPQPEQEPVAWRNAALRVGEDLCSVGPFGYYDMTAQQWLDWALSVVTVHAPPPHRKPLTDEELRVIENKINPNMRWRSSDEEGITLYPIEYYELVRAIEAAHGIKE